MAGAGAGAWGLRPGAHVAIADALAFRAARHQRFPGAAAAEHPVEINEGIATYTQYVTGSHSAEDASRLATAALSASETPASLVRTFADTSGAGYGLLRDGLSPGWHRGSLRRATLASCSQQRLE